LKSEETLMRGGISAAATLEDAYGRCRALCRSHYENFPVASRLLPRNRRDPVVAVYAFARVADDFADEPGLEAPERLARLADWRRRLRECVSSHDRHPVFWALGDTLSRFELPLDPFERLLTAFEMDVAKTRYTRFEDVLYYCRHSADPVGELVLRIFGQWNERRGVWSDAICTALQLANFWQDVTVDAAKGRLYIPLSDVRRFGATEQDVLQGPASDSLRQLVAVQVERTWALFRRGRPLCDDVPGALKWELRMVWMGGTRILEKIERQDWDVWSKRPRLGRADWAALFGRALLWRRGEAR
jgi:hydroxysqualene synthase